MEALDEIKDLLFHYARGIWKFRWIGLTITWIALIGGILYVDQIESRFTAYTKVYIDSSSILKPLLQGLAVEPDVDAAVRLMARQLLSRPNIERLIRLLDMDLDVNDPLQMEEVINDLRGRIEILLPRKGSTYTIAFADTDRDKAKRLVQTLLDIFVEDTLGKTVIESDTAIVFLDEQIEKYDGLLQEAEERREAFKRKNIGLMPKDGKNYYDKLQEGKLELEQAKLLLAESQNRRKQVNLKITELIAGNESQEVRVKTNLDKRIEKQEERVDELLLLYTDEHPDVINARLIFESLKARRLNRQQEEQDNGVSTISNNPVYQELQIILAETEGDISSFSTRVVAMEKKQAELQRLVDIVPKIETELKRLNRDYEVHRKNYNELVARREKAKISEDVESGGDQVKFRIIEPPYVPSTSSYPNRPLLDLGALAAALGVGYGICLLIALFRPVFYSQKDIRNTFSTPILGSIRKYDTPDVLSKRRRNLALFSLCNTLLLCMAGYLVHLHSKDIVILSRIKDLVF